MRHASFVRQLLLVALAIPATQTACKSGGSRSPAPAEPTTTVRVENQGFADMTIYLLRGSSRIRLGMVNGNSTATLRIPQQFVFGVTGLQFLADPVGGSRTPISSEIQVSPGDQVRLIIPPR